MRAPRRPSQRLLAWGLFVAWLVWLSAAQAWLAQSGANAWVPDVALVLAVLVLARCDAEDLVPLAFLTALARAATSGEPPVVLLAGVTGVLLLALSVRGTFELSGPLGRTLAVAAAAAAFHAWLAVAHAARTPHGAIEPAAVLGAALPVALSSAVLALFAGPLLARLPGLTPLRSRTW